MAEIIQGRKLAENIRKKAQARLEKFENPPGLAAILVGDDPASRLYVSLKEKAAKEVGIYFEKFTLDQKATAKSIIQTIEKLNQREDIHGILVQLPLPTQNEDRVIAAIDPLKDIDGFHPQNRKKLQAGETGLVPPVALAIMRLIQATNQPLRGKHGVIVGNNKIFAEPLIALGQENEIEFTFVRSDSSALASKVRAADIVISAVGQLDFITTEMVKDGAIVIDVGTNKRNGKPTGDVAPDVADQVAFISPVPGGVGPLTVAYLLTNVIRAAELQKKDLP